MKVLWISNIIFPELCKELNIESPVIAGWMQSSAKALLDIDQEIKLAVASPYDGTEVKCIDTFAIRYYLFPSKKGNQEMHFKKVYDDFLPDVTHIHGTESFHALTAVNACNPNKTVVSIQGMVSVYSNYYFGGIEKTHVKTSLRDIIRFDTLKTQQKNMAKRGKAEIEVLQKVNHVIGRTSWDKAHVWAINPNANYYAVNETLRPSFYDAQWTFSECEPYSIFLSQAHYPIKGIQQIIKTIPLVKKKFPKVKVYVAGGNIIDKPFYRKNGFAYYLEKLMKWYNVHDCFEFLGALEEKEMVKRFQKSHVFICPSAIENSPNSIGEAQLIGTPCIASYVGGSMDMIEDGKTGFLYRFEEIELLAYRICELFSHQTLCEKISKNAQIEARKRHNAVQNAHDLISLYKKF